MLVAYLRELRVVRGLTQADVAVALNRPQTYVSDIEQKKRGLDLLQVLDFCQAFDLKFEDFAVELMKRIRAKKA